MVELIDSAASEIMIVSYATHNEAGVREALNRAVARGVSITLITERTADNPGYRGAADPMPGLPARSVVWPTHQRPPGASMHAKIMVIDGTSAVVGSANLTGMAMEANLECGVLIRGGPQPAQIQRHLNALVEAGQLVQLPGGPL